MSVSRVICAFCCIHVALIALVLADEENFSSPITAWVQGENKETGEDVKIYFGNQSDSEIILKDLKEVSVHCEAEYPVQLKFKSHGGFKLLATGSGSSSKSFSNGTHHAIVQKHTTYAHLVSLKEAYTGLYTCQGRSSQTKHNTISAFIYVPTEKLFISTRTSAISSSGQGSFLIPCPVSDPNATVTLVRLHNEDTIKPVPDATFNPRTGFTVKNNFASSGDTESDDEEETYYYYCIAKTTQVQRALEFAVINGPVTCTQKCPENSKCQLVNDQQVCECKKSGYKETLVSEKCLLECKSDKDCPSNKACMPQESESFLLDILSSVEGRTSSMEDIDDSELEKRLKRIGECKNPCIHRTTSCSLGATRNTNEECRVVEHKAICNVPAN